MKKYILSLLLLLSFPTLASASEYDLNDIELTTVEETKILVTDFKATTTFQLFDILKSAQGRKEVAKKLSKEEKDIVALTKKLELMQIRGVGPRAATLLVESGVESLDALKKADPAALLETLKTVNTAKQITGVQPDLAVVRDWISAAAMIEKKAVY